MELTDVEQTLAGCEIFKGLDPKEIRTIADICQIKSYEIGELVYQQGDFGENLYIIAEGQVVLERTISFPADSLTCPMEPGADWSWEVKTV